MRKTYFPGLHRWVTTPGQEVDEKDKSYIGHDYGNQRDCLSCHTVTIPVDSLHPEPKFMGVGCEACHGPGSAHVAAWNAGKTDSSLERLNGAGGERINALCGRCHRTVEDVLAKPAFRHTTQRFPVFGLASSRCYQASGDKLTCITCHDPHRNARTEPHFYEAICLKCHTAGPVPRSTAHAGSGAEGRLSVRGKVCPVNPSTGCIACHMPRKQVFTNTLVPTAMADHLIKIHRKSRP
jgi:hypothetical protein